jgi:hypothetical protein
MKIEGKVAALFAAMAALLALSAGIGKTEKIHFEIQRSGR